MKVRRLIIAIILFNVSLLWAENQSFNISLKLLKPITITTVSNLIFPSKILSGTDEAIVVAPGDLGAATFEAQGGKNRSIVRSIVESDIGLSAPGVPGQIVVDTFVVAGPTSFDPTGVASGLKVGATANILASSQDGDYLGMATFRVIYQ